MMMISLGLNAASNQTHDGGDGADEQNDNTFPTSTPRPSPLSFQASTRKLPPPTLLGIPGYLFIYALIQISQLCVRNAAHKLQIISFSQCSYETSNI